MATTVPMTAPVHVSAPGFANQPGPLPPPPPPPPSSLNSKAAIITGSFMLALAVITILLSALSMSLFGITGNYTPIWGGVIYIPAGVLGVLAGHSKGRNSCHMVGCLVMCIISAISAANYVGGCALLLMVQDYWLLYDSDKVQIVLIIGLIVGLLTFIVALISSVFMCLGAPCCCGRRQPHYAEFAGQVAHPGQFTVQGNGMGKPQTNMQYMAQAQGQPPTYTEHEMAISDRKMLI